MNDKEKLEMAVSLMQEVIDKAELRVTTTREGGFILGSQPIVDLINIKDKLKSYLEKEMLE